MSSHSNVVVAAVIAIGVSFLPNASCAADTPVDLELVLAVDVSASVDPTEARLQRQGYVDALLDRRVVEAIQNGTLGRIAVTYIEWAGSGNRRILVPWAPIEDRASAFAFSTLVEAAPIGFGHWTAIGGAIDFAASLFEENGFIGTRRAIDLSADGPNNEGDAPDRARDRAAARGITINGLPIINDRPQASGEKQISDYQYYFRDCIIGGPNAFLVVANSFEDFSKAIRRKLLHEIADRLPQGTDTLLVEKDAVQPGRLLPIQRGRVFDCRSDPRQGSFNRRG